MPERQGRLAPGFAILLAAGELLLGIGASVSATVLPPQWTWLSSPNIVWPTLAVVFVLVLIGRVALNNKSATAHLSPRVLRPLLIGSLPSQPPQWVASSLQLNRLHKDGAQSVRHATTTVLIGESGSGKSQLAAAYARRQARAGWLVIWIDASSQASIELELSNAARTLDLVKVTWKTTTAVQLLRDYLQSNREPSLLVLDGALDESVVKDLLPAAGHILITTVFHGMGELGQIVHVKGFSVRHAHKYLEKRLPRTEKSNHQVLLHEIGSLPAALWSATGVIRSEKLSVVDYVARFQHTPVSTMLRDVRGASSNGTVAATTQCISSYQSYAASAHQELAMNRALSIASLVAPVEFEACLLSNLQADEARRIISALADWSLGVWNTQGTGIIMHDLPARIHLENMNNHDLTAVVSTFLDLTIQGSDAGENGGTVPALEGRYLLRASESLWRKSRSRITPGLTKDRLLQFRLNSADWAFREGDFTISRSLGESVVTETTPAPAQDASALHLEALDCAAHAQLADGDKEAAIVTYETVVGHRDAMLGASHHVAIRSRIGLANALRSNGDTSQASKMFKKILRQPELPLELESEAKGGLGFSLLRAGQFEFGATLLDDVVKERRARLGDTNLMTLIALTNLGCCYFNLGDPLALELLTEARKGKEVTLGANHPQTLVSSHFEGLAELNMGDNKAGRRILRATYDQRCATLGKMHPDTLATQTVIDAF